MRRRRGAGATASDYLQSPLRLDFAGVRRRADRRTGVAMLGVMVKDIVDKARASSETDALSVS